ncbi:MAG: hypothetical protein SFU83_18440 [Meiothermus sp.]|nr:hypothetical protein [Meiothermus sp.]
MDIPEYWLRRPEFKLEPSHLGHLEAVYQTHIAPARGGWVDGLEVPKWVFLDWLCEEKSLLMHGWVNPNIKEFEPREPNAKDDDAFSQQTAVFAASDGIWPMFYALLDRKRCGF